jgi:DNA-binding LacI/PurR family transcriptional regulator
MGVSNYPPHSKGTTVSTVTIYDVAKFAGVSTATVSKVLSNHPYVSARTRARVMEAVTELNYVPNIAARGLAGAKTNIIGMVVSYDSDYLFEDPHLLQILHGINRVATQNDCALLLSTALSGEDKLSAYQRLLGQRYCDGAIVEGSLGEMGLTLLRERGYPVVAVGYSELISCVHSDDRTGAFTMTHHLLELGHTRIGVVAGPETDKISTETRLRGYQDALEHTGITYDPLLVTHGNFRAPSGYAGAAYLMSLPTPPTAIFAFNDRMAFGVMEWLREQGISVPHEVSVAGFDDIPDALRESPPLTTIRQQSRAQGERAVELLLTMMADEEEATQRREIILPTELVVRGTTRAVHPH